MAKSRELEVLGAQIKSVRRQAGLTQEEAAYKSGLARSYYGGVERGERNISAENLIKIARAFEVEVGILFPSIRSL